MEKTSLKLIVSVVLILMGASLAVVFSTASSPTGSSDGILIDFGEREIVHVELVDDDSSDALSALEYACLKEGLELVMRDGKVISVNGIPDVGSSRWWRLFVTEIGSTEWTEIESDPSVIILEDYSAVAWGLCEGDDIPTTAVDASGMNYYKYKRPGRTISLAPSCTETVCAVGAFDSIVATDMYSNYPYSVYAAQQSGSIAIVGGYTNPSYELIVQQNPDMVICISSQVSHLLVAEKLRKIGIDVVVTYDGEDLKTTIDNIYMVGMAMEYFVVTEETVDELTEALNIINGTLEDHFQIKYPDVMVSLSNVKSPWVSGSGTYFSDVLEFTFSRNVYGSQNGWVQVNSESIMQYDPSVIILVTDCEPNERAYQDMLAGLPAEWKKTRAFVDGEIYVLTEITTDVASRSGPRIAQLTELVARILHPDAFEEGFVMPKYVGNNYEDYLTYTKDLNYNGGYR